MIQSDVLCVKQTMQWIQDFVIQLNLCPFAKYEMDKGLARIMASQAETLEQALVDLMSEIKHLDEYANIDTVLLVFPNGFNDFFDYLDLVDRAESTLKTAGYEGVYQLATFHPHYCFAEVDPEDPSHYSNRSPYPMVHILKEEQLEKAIHYYGDTSTIPDHNIACLRQLGLNQIHQMMNAIMTSELHHEKP